MSDTKQATAPQLHPNLLISLYQNQAEAIFDQGKESVVFALLQLAIMAAEVKIPAILSSTPSAMVPVYLNQPLLAQDESKR
jgi:hypothetical protein